MQRKLLLWILLSLIALIAFLSGARFLYSPLRNLLLLIEKEESVPSPTPVLYISTNTPVPTFIIQESISQAIQVTPIATKLSYTPLISLESFHHPNGIFDIASGGLPSSKQTAEIDQSVDSEGWSVVHLDDYSASLHHDKSNITITIEATNTGYELDHKAREEFINARERKLFGDTPGYFKISQLTSQRVEMVTQTITNSLQISSIAISAPITSQITGTVPYTITILTTKTVLDNGNPRLVTTRYWQFSNIIYAIDIWMDQDYSDNYLAQVDAITQKIIFYPNAASALPVYGHSYLESDPQGIVQISVPAGWTENVLNDAFTYAVTYYSPDRHAAIQLITYDDGNMISKSIAGSFTLLLLNSYMTADVMVTEDRVQTNGVEQLVWHSPRYNYDFKGISSFETIDETTYILFSTVYDVPFESLYLDVLRRSMNSYTIFCEGDCESTPP
jgi:hypothetical protein